MTTRDTEKMARIGSGGFGEVYGDWDLQQGKLVAIKRPKFGDEDSLTKEKSVYKELHSGNKRSHVPVPTVYESTTSNDPKSIKMDFFPFSLEELFNACNRNFSLKTILQIADQMLRAIEFVHSKGYLHLDIKPKNFMVGSGEQLDKIFLVDFGLSEKYIKDRKHDKICLSGCVGTLEFASIPACLSLELGRRSDLESIGYILVYFMKKKLPWTVEGQNGCDSGLESADKKLSTDISELCEGLPHEFAGYISYTRLLEYDELPDYAYLRSLFSRLYHRCGFIDDGRYDWSSLSFEEILLKSDNEKK